MDNRQRFLKALYPLIMFVNRATGLKFKIMENNENIVSKASLYSLGVQLNNGSELRLESLKGKKILLVNTASNCGYTGQYDDLQKLYEQYKGKLNLFKRIIR